MSPLHLERCLKLPVVKKRPIAIILDGRRTRRDRPQHPIKSLRGRHWKSSKRTFAQLSKNSADEDNLI